MMWQVRIFSFCCVASSGFEVLPDMMKAAVLLSRKLNTTLDYDNIAVIDVPVPKPGLGQVLIKVRGSSVNPVDMQLVESPLEWFWRYPHTLGFDVSGVVVSHGFGCSPRLVTGDEVYAQMGTIIEAAKGGGAWAEYVAVAERVVAKKPKGLNFTEAGVLPMVALTSLLNLQWAAHPATKRLDNMTVAVLGGSGGTGHVGIQMAKALGAAEVIATCTSTHFDFVKSLGADRTLDYHQKEWFNSLPEVDVVYDTVGHGKNIVDVMPKLKHGGRYASLTPEGAAGRKARALRPDAKWMNRDCIVDCVQHDRLEIVTGLVESGKLRPHLDTIFSLSEVKAAVQLREAGHVTGKVAVVIPQPQSALIV